MATIEIEFSIDEFTDPQTHSGWNAADIELRDSRSANRLRLSGTPEALVTMVEELYAQRWTLIKAINRREEATAAVEPAFRE